MQPAASSTPQPHPAVLPQWALHLMRKADCHACHLAEHLHLSCLPGIALRPIIASAPARPQWPHMELRQQPPGSNRAQPGSSNPLEASTACSTQAPVLDIWCSTSHSMTMQHLPVTGPAANHPQKHSTLAVPPVPAAKTCTSRVRGTRCMQRNANCEQAAAGYSQQMHCGTVTPMSNPAAL